MAIDLKLTPEEKQRMNNFVKPTPRGVPMLNEKIGEKSPRTLPIRGR